MRITRAVPGLVAAALFCVPTASAGQVTVGIKGGVTFADARFDGSFTSTAREGAITGGFVALPISTRASVQFEALYTMKGFSTTGFRVEGASARIPYMDIPIVFRFRLTERQGRVRPLLMAGPFYGFELGCSTEGAIVDIEGSDSCDDRFRGRGTADVGFVLGGGIEFGVSAGLRLSVDGRYHLGLRNVRWEPDTESVQSRGWSVMAGLGLLFGD